MGTNYLRKSLATLAFAGSMLIGTKSYSQNNNLEFQRIDYNSSKGKFMPWNYSKEDSLSLKRIDERINKEIQKPNNKKDKYAFLVTGYDSPPFKFDLTVAYRILLESGFKKENVYVLDEVGEENFLYKSDGIASKKAIEKILGHLENIVDKKDMFVMHIGGHGTRVADYTKLKTVHMDTVLMRRVNTDSISRALSVLPFNYPDEFRAVFMHPEYDSITQVGLQGQSAKMLWYGYQPAISPITEKELDSLVSKINPELGLVITGVCYGGGIVERLDKKNYVRISASKDDEFATAGIGHSFLAYFYQAFSNDNESDLDKDGLVNIIEAFNYAKVKISKIPLDEDSAIWWIDNVKVNPTPMILYDQKLQLKKISLK